MFSDRVVAASEAKLHDAFRDAIPGGQLIRRPPDLCWAYRDQLSSAADAKGTLTRALTPDEDAFIAHERLLCTIDFRYWAERYAFVVKESSDAEPLTPLWVSQDLFLSHLGALEAQRHGVHPDGILVNVLKARQLGLSTISEVILAHRITTQQVVRGIVAADVEEQSKAMFSMAEFVISNLPWWLKPPLGTPTTQGRQITFATGARLSSFWGKSSRGGLQDREKVKGNIGRGRTFTLGHLSELSTWERPEQIEDGLLPGVPIRPRTLFIFESTAKGRYDWWHTWWDKADRNVGRFANIFIPWYIEPDKYWLPPPEGWVPLSTTKQHADEVERDSPRWCLGRTVRLSREQMYWYERTRANFDDSARGPEFTAEGRRLPTFYEEYPASPRDAFQHAGQSIFGPSVLDRLKRQERPPLLICAIEPAKDIAQLRAWERAKQRDDAETAALSQS